MMMFPVINVGPAAIQAPGLILMVGFWLSLSLASRRAMAEGVPENAVYNAGFAGVLFGLVGARLGYVAQHWSAYQNDLSGALALSTEALSTEIGLMVGIGTGALYLYRHRISVPALLDVLAPAIALFLAFVSLANLSSGSGYGSTTRLPWAIELWGARRHPTQIYELLAGIGTLAVLWWSIRRKPFAGFLFLLLLLLYGSARLFLDAFRADPWILAGGFRGIQVVSLAMVLLSLWLMGRQVARVSSV
jgi:phosphatidylglycerol:prolipoprotein diacylglycerol transferase